MTVVTSDNRCGLIPKNYLPSIPPSINSLPTALDPAHYYKAVSGSASTQSSVASIPLPTIAANQIATVTGDPHVKEADGGKFDFQGEAGKTYNLLNDTGLIVNAKFQEYNGKKDLTSIGEMGMIISGNGTSSVIKIDPKKTNEVYVNNEPIHPGQSVTLADGGQLNFTKENKIIITTHEGYVQTVNFKINGMTFYLDYEMKSGNQGVNGDGKIPGGLVGHTFDADTHARNGKTGKGANGEGAIDGIASDYEVPGGIYGAPQFQILKPGAYPSQPVKDPLYDSLLGIPEGTNPLLYPPQELQSQWNQTLQNNSKENEDRKIKKLELLLMMALNSGNLDMAIMLMSGIESKRANQIAAGLVKNIQELQKQRQDMMTQASDPKIKNDPGKMQELNMKAGDKNTEINMIQTFIQDLMAQKNETQQLASNYLKSKHDTARAILGNMN